MNRVVKILMERDGMTEEKAKAEVKAGREDIYNAIADGSTTDDVEDMLSDLFGLEPDYIFDIL